MTLGEWAAVADEKLSHVAPALAAALRGKGATDPIGIPLPSGLAFEQPYWSGNGFVSAWPSPWALEDLPDEALVVFYEYADATLDGAPYAERRYALTRVGAEDAADDIAQFLASGHDRWRHPANLRERRPERDTFVTDLIHEFGHAVVAELRSATVLDVVIQGIEVHGEAVNVTVGGHVNRWTGTREFQRWDATVIAVSGLVAERLHADRAAPFVDPTALFLADRSYYSDLEGAISGVLDSRPIEAMSLERKRFFVEAAVEQARAALTSHMGAMESEAARWKRLIIDAPVSELRIPWKPEQRNALLGAPLDSGD